MYSLVECNSDNLNAKLWPGWSLWILRMGARCIHQVGKRPACLSLSPQPSPDDSHRFLTFFSDTSSSQRIPGIKYNLESMVITLPKYIYLLCLRDFYFLRISKMLNPHFCPVTKNRPVHKHWDSSVFKGPFSTSPSCHPQLLPPGKISSIINSVGVA